MDSENIIRPLVSIITPSFNQGKFIEETILSVLIQDYPNIEYIIIDGGSTDNTIQIIKKHKDKLHYWVSEKDEGQTDAIIKGFNRAKGKYITWLCSDDVIEPSMISTSVAFLETHPEVVMTYGDRTRMDAKSNIVSAQKYCQFRPWLLKWGFAIPQETCLMRRDAYEKTGGLDISLHMAMDFDIFCKLSKIGCIVHLPAFLGRFRTHATNKSNLFTQEVRKTGFRHGKPYELSLVYKKHFKSNFPVIRWRWVSLVNFIFRQIDKHTKKVKFLKSFITTVK